MPKDPLAVKTDRFWSRIRRMLRAGMWLTIFTYLFSFFGQRYFVAELLANFRIQFLVLFVFLLILSRFAKAGWPLIAGLAIVFAWTGWESGQLYIPVQQPPAGKTKIRVMSYNVLGTNSDFQSSISEIRKHDPDIVAVLEYANMWHQALDALNESHPFQHRDPRWHGYGIAIFSKLPFENAGSLPLTEDTIDNPAATVTVRVDGRPLRFMAVHVMSPTNRFRLELRNRQFEEIAAQVNSDSIETILVGDMNCNPSSRYLTELIGDTNMRDSRQGFGLHPSWPSFAPPLAIPIDHVLISKSIHVHQRFLGDARGSDHRPVIVDVSIGAK